MEDGAAIAAAACVQASVRGRQARQAVDALERTRQLRTILAESGKRVQDFFALWDVDGSGEIEREEFGPALRALGFDVSAEEARALFDSFDTDASGQISHKELYRQLRAGADVDLSSERVVDKFGAAHQLHLAAGSAGEIALEAKNQIAIRHDARRKRYSALPAAVDLVEAEDGGAPVVEQLRAVLAENAVRVIDLFRDWDVDQSGTVSVLEFCRSVAALGYTAPLDDVRRLFGALDADGSGALEYAELHKALRRGADVVLDAKLRVGGAGPIQTRAALRNEARIVGCEIGCGAEQRKIQLGPETQRVALVDLV